MCISKKKRNRYTYNLNFTYSKYYLDLLQHSMHEIQIKVSAIYTRFLNPLMNDTNHEAVAVYMYCTTWN